MFLNVRVKNFKSLSNFEFNLEEKKGKPKNIALVYGENGSGKTNIVSIFSVLVETLHSMKIRTVIEDYLEIKDDTSPETFIKMLRSTMPSIERMIEENKTIGCHENMVLDFEFSLNGHMGRYFLAFDDKQLVREKLEYLIDKQKGILFDITSETKKIHPKLVKDKNYLQEIEDNIDKFWGKHTLMSVFIFELLDKNAAYFEKNINRNLLDILLSFALIKSVDSQKNTFHMTSTKLNIPLGGDFIEGEISIKRKHEIHLATQILTHIFSGLYSDVKDLYYKIDMLDQSRLKYELFLKKKIGGTVRDIPFKLESSGTKKILTLVSLLFTVMQGDTVIIDEFDSGIHDVMVKELFLAIADSLSGQLIITTHNTLLLEEAHIDNKFIYILKVDEDGNKSIDSLDKENTRVQQNHNRRNQYLKGMYEGVPFVGHIDFDYVIDEMTAQSEVGENIYE